MRSMSRGRVLVAVVAVVVIAAGAGVLLSMRSPDDAPEAARLGAATQLADGSEYPGLTGYDSLINGETDDPTLDHLPLSEASKVVADDSGGFWLLLKEHAVGDGLGVLARGAADGELLDAGSIPLGYPMAFTARDGVRAIGARSSAEDHAVDVYEPPDRPGRWRTFVDFGDRERFDLPFPLLGALAVTDDGTVLASAAGGEGLIAARDPDGAMHNVLGPPGDPDAAQAPADQPLGEISAIVPLSDGRVAFVADGADDFQLYLLDDDGVRPVDTGDVNPVTAEARYDRGGRLVNLDYDQLAPGPEGRLLAIGMERRSAEIFLVDPDGGQTDLLISLSGIRPSPERPISAAAVGDDLIFLADGALWALRDAF